MRIVAGLSALFLILGSPAALAQDATLPSKSSMKMEMHGSAVTGSSAVQNPLFSGLDEFPNDIPTNQISKFANGTISDVAGTVRSAKDAQIYRSISPAVVLVATKEGFGSGSLLDTAGNIITNWHVVKGYEYVAVIFKPTVEGKEPTRDDIKRGRVVKYDEIADLALVKVSEVPTGRTPVRLGDTSEIAVGMDVHAIGHPHTTFGDNLPNTFAGYIPAVPMVALAVAELGRVPLASAIFNKHKLIQGIAVVGIMALGYLAAENWTFGFERIVDLRLKIENAASRELSRADADLAALVERRKQMTTTDSQKRDELRRGIDQRNNSIAELSKQLSREA